MLKNTWFCFVLFLQFCLILLVAQKLQTWSLIEKREREKKHFTKLADLRKNFRQPQIYVVVDKM